MRRALLLALPAAGAAAPPATMRAVQMASAPVGPGGGPACPDLSCVALADAAPTPRPGAGQVLIKVAASSVNPVDWKIPEYGYNTANATFPLTLGLDAAGTVAAVGADGCAHLSVGDEVWADVAPTLGAYAEYALAACAQVGRKPPSLSWSEAASLPLVSLTSYEAFVTYAGAPWAGRPTVLLTTGAGGCGFTGVQLARALGAGRIITTTGPENIAFVKSLGADVVYDYTKENWWDVVPNGTVDVVYDVYGVGGDRAMGVLKSPGGVFVTIASAPSEHPKPGVRQYHFLTNSSDYATLDQLAALVESGKLRPHVDAEFPLSQTVAAFRQEQAAPPKGKLVITI